MTLDEAIKHAEEVAEEQENNAKNYPRPDKSVKGSGKKYNTCLECAKEHRQLVEWLKELKQLREQASMSHDINVTISMRVPINSLNHIVADDVKRLLISNGYDVKHVNIQLAIPIGGWENY